MQAVKSQRLDSSLMARRNPLISRGRQGGKKPMQHARFVRTVWFPLALVLAGFAGGCGSSEGPATGPVATGRVVNGVPEVTRVPEVVNGVPQTDEGPGKRAMHDPKG